jgi:hypothetical protein
VAAVLLRAGLMRSMAMPRRSHHTESLERLKRPFGLANGRASATAAGWIVPKKYVDKIGDDGFKKAPIGAGPYKFVSFNPGVELVLEAFDQYWRKPALGRQGFVLDAGADDVKAVEPGLLGDAEGTAGKGKAVFTDSNVEQLGEFVAVFDAADGARDPVVPLG